MKQQTVIPKIKCPDFEECKATFSMRTDVDAERGMICQMLKNVQCYCTFENCSAQLMAAEMEEHQKVSATWFSYKLN